jgi:hypothetical protein
MQIKVKTLTGKEIEFDIEPTGGEKQVLRLILSVVWNHLTILFFFIQTGFIENLDTVRRIKERVEEKEGIPPQQQVYINLKCLFHFPFEMCKYVAVLMTHSCFHPLYCLSD